MFGLLDVFDEPVFFVGYRDDTINLLAIARFFDTAQCDSCAGFCFEISGECPIGLRNECADLALTLDEDAQCGRLYATRRETIADFLPDNSREVVADEAIEHAPRLLRVVLENLIGTYVVGTELKLSVALALIIGVLIVRPQGLLGRRVVTRV